MLAISKVRAKRKLAIQRPLGTHNVERSGKGLLGVVISHYAAPVPFFSFTLGGALLSEISS